MGKKCAQKIEVNTGLVKKRTQEDAEAILRLSRSLPSKHETVLWIDMQ